jgi:hypothetical protein
LDKCTEERFSVYGIACNDVLIQTGLVDYLADVPNPSQGVPVVELAAKLELDPQKLIPILRCSAANGWVRETRDSSFALNRCARTFIEGHAGRRLNVSYVFTLLYECPLNLNAKQFTRIYEYDRNNTSLGRGI